MGRDEGRGALGGRPESGRPGYVGVGAGVEVRQLLGPTAGLNTPWLVEEMQGQRRPGTVPGPHHRWNWG